MARRLGPSSAEFSQDEPHWSGGQVGRNGSNGSAPSPLENRLAYVRVWLVHRRLLGEQQAIEGVEKPTTRSIGDDWPNRKEVPVWSFQSNCDGTGRVIKVEPPTPDAAYLVTLFFSSD